jgi:hypothetical protein
VRVHRTLDGSWDSCADEACVLIFHFDDMSVEAAQAMPMQVLLPLLNTIQPPHAFHTEQHWWLDAEGQPHRDYDLPSAISEDGDFWWSQHGISHRDGALPAFVDARGRQEWWVHGQLHREDGPALINESGEEYWYSDGERIEPLDPMRSPF